MNRGFLGNLASYVRDAGDGGTSTPFGLWSMPSATGIQINQQTALQVSTCMACVSVLAEDTSKMPPRLFKYVPKLGYWNGSRHYLGTNEHALVRLLRMPNDWQTWPEFCQQMMIGMVLRGNAYAVILRDRNGFPTKLVPINPDRVALLEAANGMLFFNVARAGLHEMAVLRDQPLNIPYEDVLHIKGLSQNGLVGMSKIAINREAIALALAQEQQYARMMGNGARPSGILTTKEKITDVAAAKIRDDWNSINSGLVNSGRTAILEYGLTWQPLTLSSVDMQFLQLRGFQVQEIARLFRVPPHMVGDMSRVAFNSLTQLSQDYRNNTLMTYTTLIEHRLMMTFDLWDDEIVCECDTNQLMRADLLTRYNAHRIGILTAFEKPNEARIDEGKDVDEDGDKLLSPTNMAPLGTLPGDGETPPGSGANNSTPGSDQTGVGEPGAGKPTEKVTTNNQPASGGEK